MTTDTTTSHFGYETIPAAEKVSRVRGVFDSVASRYDVMNDVMSFGMHRLWKRAMIDALTLAPNMRLLDLAGGTGDIAFAALKRQPSLHIDICDINAEMLRHGRRRAYDANILHGIKWTCGNAESLPFPDAHFDRVSIAFGIRNVTHIALALQEIHRVLKPGGTFVCLEFSTPALPWLERLYDVYSFHMIPRLGQWITGDAASYRYLVESIRMFPIQDAFAAMLREAGFRQVTYRNLTGGIVALHKGVVI